VVLAILLDRYERESGLSLIVNFYDHADFNFLNWYCRFDGDGMIHGLNIKDGKATYVARYVRTSRLEQEEFYGAPKFVKV